MSHRVKFPKTHTLRHTPPAKDPVFAVFLCLFTLAPIMMQQTFDISNAGFNSTSPNTVTLSVSLYTPEMTSMLHGCLSFNRFNSCRLLLMLVCFPSAGCSCQVTLKCSCLFISVSVSYQFHELDTDQIICKWLRMDLGYKNLSLSVLSPVPLSFRSETINLFFLLGRAGGHIIGIRSALYRNFTLYMDIELFILDTFVEIVG